MLLHLVIIFKLILVKKRVSNLAAQQSIRCRIPILNLRYSHLFLQINALDYPFIIIELTFAIIIRIIMLLKLDNEGFHHI